MNNLVQRFYRDGGSNGSSTPLARDTPSPKDLSGYDYFSLDSAAHSDTLDSGSGGLTSPNEAHDELGTALKELSDLIIGLRRPAKVETESKSLVFDYTKAEKVQRKRDQLFPRNYGEFVQEKHKWTRHIQSPVGQTPEPIASPVQEINAIVLELYEDQLANDLRLHELYRAFVQLRRLLEVCNEKLSSFKRSIVAKIQELNIQENKGIHSEETVLKEQLDLIKVLEDSLDKLKAEVDQGWETLETIDKQLDQCLKDRALLQSQQMERNKAIMWYVIGGGVTAGLGVLLWKYV